MRPQYVLITLFAAAAPLAGQDVSGNAKKDGQPAPIAKGEVVSEMAKDLWYVFQARDGHYWFGSRTEGAFRYDGKAITRFMKKDGLAGDDVGGIQEDKAGTLFISTSGGISRFDGRSFTTLKPVPASEWKKEPDDIWFGGLQ